MSYLDDLSRKHDATLKTVERLRAELRSAYACLGDEYEGEWELACRRRPLDSLVSEVVGQLDNATEQIDRLRAAVKLYREATFFGASHTQHWDKTYQSGAGCPMCTEVRRLREDADAILEEPSE